MSADDYCTAMDKTDALQQQYRGESQGTVPGPPGGSSRILQWKDVSLEIGSIHWTAQDIGGFPQVVGKLREIELVFGHLRTRITCQTNLANTSSARLASSTPSIASASRLALISAA